MLHRLGEGGEHSEFGHLPRSRFIDFMRLRSYGQKGEEKMGRKFLIKVISSMNIYILFCGSGNKVSLLDIVKIVSQVPKMIFYFFVINYYTLSSTLLTLSHTVIVQPMFLSNIYTHIYIYMYIYIIFSNRIILTRTIFVSPSLLRTL